MLIYLATSDLSCGIWVLSSCGTWALQLLCAGLVAPRHVGSFPSQDHTPPMSTPLQGGFLSNWTTKEVPKSLAIFVSLVFIILKIKIQMFNKKAFSKTRYTVNNQQIMLQNIISWNEYICNIKFKKQIIKYYKRYIHFNKNVCEEKCLNDILNYFQVLKLQEIFINFIYIFCN